MASGAGDDEAAAGAAPGDWERHVDDASGATYYYNSRTGASSWEEPDGFVARAESEEQEQDAGERKPARWRRFTDDDSGKTYYYDEANDVTQWDEPEVFVAFSESDSEGEEEAGSHGQGDEEVEGPQEDAEDAEQHTDSLSKEELSSEDKAQTPVASTSAESSVGNTPASTNASTWAKFVDAASGKPYFYNAITRVTQWEQPSGYREPVATTAPAVSAEYQSHLVRVQTERLSRVTQQVLDPTGSLSKLNAILSGIGGAPVEDAAEGGDAGEEASHEKPEWQQHVDPQTQRYYYYNTVTGVTQWQKPDAAIASGLADWIPPEIPEESGERPKTVSGINYVARAKFNRLTGKYEQHDNDEYWNSVGAPSDRAGRQMSHFFDMTALEKNREEARRKTEALKRKNINWKKVAAEKKAKKQKQKNEWIYTD